MSWPFRTDGNLCLSLIARRHFLKSKQIELFSFDDVYFGSCYFACWHITHNISWRLSSCPYAPMRLSYFAPLYLPKVHILYLNEVSGNRNMYKQIEKKKQRLFLWINGKQQTAFCSKLTVESLSDNLVSSLVARELIQKLV